MTSLLIDYEALSMIITLVDLIPFARLFCDFPVQYDEGVVIVIMIYIKKYLSLNSFLDVHISLFGIYILRKKIKSV